MEYIYRKIWRLALPYLSKGIRKDFVLHTKMVVKGMKLLLKKERGDKDILIPAAILHDTGWANVPHYLQKAQDSKRIRKAMELHLKLSAPIIKEILCKVNFKTKKIKRVTDIVLAHKYKNPRALEKRMLIDADTLSDVFKEQFYSDAKIYKVMPEDFFHIRRNNKFYTETAREIFQKELNKRAREIEILKDNLLCK
jgi:hypothetical protein